MESSLGLPSLVESKSAYELWQEKEGIPVYRGASIENLGAVKLGQWKRKGVLGAFINLADQESADSYVLEIPPKSMTKPQQHLFEEMIFILSGRGATTIVAANGSKHVIEWQKGSVFAVPLNSVHQHFNNDGSKPARYVAVTNAPMIHNLFHNSDFVYANPFKFADRLNFEPSSLKGSGKFVAKRVWETNFVPDVMAFQLIEWKERGPGARTVNFELAENTMAAHVSEFPVGTYKKAHRHGPGAHLIILNGTGYTLMWEAGKAMQRYDWKPGTMLSPSDMWYHQHFNTGKDPARYLAMRWGSKKHLMGADFIRRTSETGGEQIELEDENPEVRAMFEGELAKHGVESKMPVVSKR